MTLKENIIRLREQGLTYNEISKELDCSKGTISYHLVDKTREDTRERTRNRRRKHPLVKKVETFRGKIRKSLDNRTQGFQSRTLDVDVRRNYDRRNFTFTYKDVVSKFGDHPVCGLTGLPLDWQEPDTYQLDHIIPASKGGDNSLENMQVLCAEVNKMKHAFTEEELIVWCELIVNHHTKMLAPEDEIESPHPKVASD